MDKELVGDSNSPLTIADIEAAIAHLDAVEPPCDWPIRSEWEMLPPYKVRHTPDGWWEMSADWGKTWIPAFRSANIQAMEENHGY